MANVDSDRKGDAADSNCLDDVEPDDLAWAEAITQLWADDLADSRQDIYTPADGHPTDGGDVRPPSADTTANEGRR